MVVEAVDRLFGFPLRRTPLAPGTPCILDEISTQNSGIEALLPTWSVRPIDDDTLKVIDHLSGVSDVLVRGEINAAKLRVRTGPNLGGFIRSSVEWRPYRRLYRR